jgi:hypothetical protein
MAFSDLSLNQMVTFTDAQSSGFSLKSGQSHVTSNQCMTKSEALLKYVLSDSPMSTYSSNQLVPKSAWENGGFYTIKLVYFAPLSNNPEKSNYYVYYTKSDASMPNLVTTNIVISGSVKFNQIGNQSGTSNNCAILGNQTNNSFSYNVNNGNLKNYLLSLMTFNQYYQGVTGCGVNQPTYGLVNTDYGNFTLNTTSQNDFSIIIMNAFTNDNSGTLIN